MISHHDLATFKRYADKIYQFVPLMGGVTEVRGGEGGAGR